MVELELNIPFVVMMMMLVFSAQVSETEHHHEIKSYSCLKLYQLQPQLLSAVMMVTFVL